MHVCRSLERLAVRESKSALFVWLSIIIIVVEELRLPGEMGSGQSGQRENEIVMTQSAHHYFIMPGSRQEHIFFWWQVNSRECVRGPGWSAVNILAHIRSVQFSSSSNNIAREFLSPSLFLPTSLPIVSVFTQNSTGWGGAGKFWESSQFFSFLPGVVCWPCPLLAVCHQWLQGKWKKKEAWQVNHVLAP